MSTAADIPVQIIVPNDTNSRGPPLLSAERRITPSWTVAQLKAKLEPVTGIPASAQAIRTKNGDGGWISLNDEASVLADSKYGLKRGSEVEIADTRPAHARQSFLSADLSSVEKYQMPEAQYEKLDDSVLAWKKRQQLGRFDPNAKSPQEVAQERLSHDKAAIQSRGIKAGLRSRIGNDDGRRGTVKFVGEIPGLGGAREAGCVWVGIELDEPVGRNDGSVEVSDDAGANTIVRLFECRDKFGVFARPEKVEVGDFAVLDDLDDDMEEI